MNPILVEDVKNIVNEPIQWERLKGKSVMITGASGMVGSYMMRTLWYLNQTRDYQIHIIGVVRNVRKVAEEFQNDPNIEILVHDVTQPFDYSGNVDFLIHAASPASPLIMKEQPVETVAANTLGAYYTLQLAKEKNTEEYVFISSREIYGQPYEGQEMFQEDTYGFVDPLDARSCYPEGKKVAETMCASFWGEYGLHAKSARLAHTYGPGMSIYDGRVQADFLKNVISNEDIVLKSEGLPVRTYTYISDAIAGIFFVLLNGKEIAYNIGDEQAKISIRELAELLVKIVPEKKLSLRFEIPKGGLKGTAPFTLGILDSSRLRTLGWKPRYTLEEGFRRTIDYLEIEKKEGRIS